jgi:hypothetical protein
VRWEQDLDLRAGAQEAQPAEGCAYGAPTSMTAFYEPTTRAVFVRVERESEWDECPAHHLYAMGWAN